MCARRFFFFFLLLHELFMQRFTAFRSPCLWFAACFKQNDDASCTELYLRFFFMWFVLLLLMDDDNGFFFRWCFRLASSMHHFMFLLLCVFLLNDVIAFYIHFISLCFVHQASCTFYIVWRSFLPLLIAHIYRYNITNNLKRKMTKHFCLHEK